MTDSFCRGPSAKSCKLESSVNWDDLLILRLQKSPEEAVEESRYFIMRRVVYNVVMHTRARRSEIYFCAAAKLYDISIDTISLFFQQP